MSEPKLSLKKKKIRSFFLTFEKNSKSREDIKDELIDVGLKYIQMKLPIEKITPAFEQKIKEKVELNILRAKIREATLDDLESVKNIYNRAWLTSNEPYTPITVDALREIYNYQDSVIFIAKVYGSDAGFMILDREGPNKEYGVICGLGVEIRFQGRGLGTVLGFAAWNYFKEKGVIELRCEVYEKNSASQFFINSMGFEEYGVKVYKKNDFSLEEELE
ncbi:MAG: GNAT family N-acetyltransferase [Promethearchaeota archaeon]